MLFRFLNSEAHVQGIPAMRNMGLFLSCFTAGKTTLQIKTGKEKNKMKWKKAAAVLSLLLALSISLSACGGGAAEPSPSSESEEAPYSEETSDTASRPS